MARRKKQPKNVETLKHDEARRTYIPTAEFEAVMADDEKNPIRVAYERRNRDLDPQLVWRGKDEQDWSDLVVSAPPLYIQEKVHPKVLIEDLLSESKARAEADTADQAMQMDLFADFNGVPDGATGTDFYQHDANWTNRMILGDSLQVMASLAEREGLRGQVQCIYIDPPYGIKFNSNFQWSTTSRDVKDGKFDHITREPEQVKAFRDTWRDGIHSYLTYLRDRLTVARELLSESGSIFVQIGDENIHRVRALLDEIFGESNFKSIIQYVTNSGLTQAEGLATVGDYILWYAKDSDHIKFRKAYQDRPQTAASAAAYSKIQLPNGERRSLTKLEKNGRALPNGAELYRHMDISKPGPGSRYTIRFEGRTFTPGKRWWGTTPEGVQRLKCRQRLAATRSTLWTIKFYDDFAFTPFTNHWSDTASSFASDKIYVVQTNTKIVQRCILMTSDPGDLVLDPTCGSGTSAYVAEQWGRRWITIDTSRVALALARSRIIGARYPYYLLADTAKGKEKEAEITRTAIKSTSSYGNIRQGFVYERAGKITMGAIVKNSEIDVIWEYYQEKLEPLRNNLNKTLIQEWEEWEIPREAAEDWPDEAKRLHADWWNSRIERQKEIDASINAKADFEFLYDRPYEDKSIVRVAGPFTVESLSPHRVLVVNEEDELRAINGDFIGETSLGYGSDAPSDTDFVQVILENLKSAGVQQAHKEDRITFSSLSGWPGDYICAEGRYLEGENEKERRAGIFIGPEFGTVPRADLVVAAHEAGDAGFDVLIACAFNYDAHSAEFEKLGRIPILKARMNADLHMADELAKTSKGNLFVIFGEPDIDIESVANPDDDEQIRVKIHGVDVFHPQSGRVESSGADGIACWFIDDDYNEESFFVRQAYFLGANDPYKSLKTTLKAEIDREAWESLHSDVSRPFDRPSSGRIAVKVINHLGDEVMKVFAV